MQEFTVSTSNEIEPEDNQGEIGTIPSEASLQGDVGATEISQIRGKRSRSFISIILTLLVGLAPAVMGWGYLHFKTKDSGNNDVEVKGLQVERISDGNNMSLSQLPTSVKDKIFFTDKYNVFMSDKDGSNKGTLTEYEDGALLEDLKLINESTLGFFRCKGSISDYGCKILTVDLNTKEDRTVRTIDPEALLLQLDWIDVNEYVYSVQYPQERTLIGVYIKDDVEKQIFEHKSLGSNRDQFIEDNSQLRFSPEGDKVYQIFTEGGRGFDFTIYVYNLLGDLVDEIKDATYPCWIDNNTIVYRRYSNKSSGFLYIRDVVDKESVRLEKSSMAAYGPKVFSGKIFFWEVSGFGSIYVYDLDKGTISLLYKNSTFPVILSPEEIIIATTRACKEGECRDFGTFEYETQFVIDAFVVFNLTSGEETPIEASPEELYGGFITWYQRNF